MTAPPHPAGQADLAVTDLPPLAGRDAVFPEEAQQVRYHRPAARQQVVGLQMRARRKALGRAEQAVPGRPHGLEHRRLVTEGAADAVVHQQQFLHRRRGTAQQRGDIVPGAEIEPVIAPPHHQGAKRPQPVQRHGRNARRAADEHHREALRAKLLDAPDHHAADRRDRRVVHEGRHRARPRQAARPGMDRVQPRHASQRLGEVGAQGPHLLAQQFRPGTQQRAPEARAGGEGAHPQPPGGPPFRPVHHGRQAASRGEAMAGERQRLHPEQRGHRLPSGKCRGIHGRGLDPPVRGRSSDVGIFPRHPEKRSTYISLIPPARRLRPACPRTPPQRGNGGGGGRSLPPGPRPESGLPRGGAAVTRPAVEAAAALPSCRR